MRTILYIHLVSTLMLTGLIWTIQIVHYPLFNRVGESAFRAYEAAHTNAITLLVLPLMLVELLTALALVVTPPTNVPPLLLWAGLGLVGVVWFMTAFVHVPQHGRLAAGFDEVTYQALVTSNWVRTITWSLRAALVVYILDKATSTA